MQARTRERGAARIIPTPRTAHRAALPCTSAAGPFLLDRCHGSGIRADAAVQLNHDRLVILAPCHHLNQTRAAQITQNALDLAYGAAS